MARGIGIKNYDQNNTTVIQQLNILGQAIVKEAKLIVKKEHYDTGQLYRSLKYTATSTGSDKFQLNIIQMYYGKYVNDMPPQPGYMDRAIEDNLDQGIEDIINVQINDILDPILDDSGNKVRYPKKNWGRP